MKSARVRAVLGLVSELSESEQNELRAEFGRTLLSSPEEWDSAWNDELSRRIDRIESGDVDLVEGAHVLANLRGDLSE